MLLLWFALVSCTLTIGSDIGQRKPPQANLLGVMSLGLWGYTFSRVLCGTPVAAADSVYLQLRLIVPAGYTCRLARDLLYKLKIEPSSTQGSPGLL
jgi:hypothetical protein